MTDKRSSKGEFDKKGKRDMQPPTIKKIAKKISQHGTDRVDDYDWIRVENWKDVLQDPKNLGQEVREYLEAENAYTKSHFDKCSGLTKKIGDELVGRIIPTESSIPSKHDDWEYWVEYREKGNYPVYKRRHLKSGDEQMVFDGDKEAKGHEFFDIHGVNHSPDHKYMSYAVDKEGSEYYEIRVREIATGKEFSEVVPQSAGYCTWSTDCSRFYYIELDDNHKPKKVKCHVLGEDPAKDITVYHEKDDGYFLNIHKTNSGKFMMITSGNSETSEVQFFDADAKGQPKLNMVRPREAGIQYSVHHHGDDFYIHTNKDGATEYKIMKTPVAKYQDKNWQEFLPARSDTTLEGIDLLKDYMIRYERHNALSQVVVSDYKGNEYKIEMPDAAYEMGGSTGYEYDTQKMRIHYDTMAHPGLTFEVDLKTGKKKVIKERKLPNGHDPSEYIIEREYIKARDGEEVPVTIIRHKSVKPNGKAPLHMYGYGSYGATSPSGFSKNAISLVDRGIVYAVAHIRGSGDKGEAWHKDGKKLNKKNTFFDFIDATEAMIEKGYGQKGKVTMEGRSAGGMLMGAVMNMRPDLYGFVIALSLIHI